MEQFKYVNYNVEPVSSNAFMGFHDTQISREILNCTVVNLGKDKKYSGTTLVALYRFCQIRDLLLKPFNLERLQKFNKSSGLADL